VTLVSYYTIKRAVKHKGPLLSFFFGIFLWHTIEKGFFEKTGNTIRNFLRTRRIILKELGMCKKKKKIETAKLFLVGSSVFFCPACRDDKFGSH